MKIQSNHKLIAALALTLGCAFSGVTQAEVTYLGANVLGVGLGAGIGVDNHYPRYRYHRVYRPYYHCQWRGGYYIYRHNHKRWVHRRCV